MHPSIVFIFSTLKDVIPRQSVTQIAAPLQIKAFKWNHSFDIEFQPFAILREAFGTFD